MFWPVAFSDGCVDIDLAY